MCVLKCMHVKSIGLTAFSRFISVHSTSLFGFERAAVMRGGSPKGHLLMASLFGSSVFVFPRPIRPSKSMRREAIGFEFERGVSRAMANDAYFVIFRLSTAFHLFYLYGSSLVSRWRFSIKSTHIKGISDQESAFPSRLTYSQSCDICVTFIGNVWASGWKNVSSALIRPSWMMEGRGMVEPLSIYDPLEVSLIRFLVSGGR